MNAALLKSDVKRVTLTWYSLGKIKARLGTCRAGFPRFTANPLAGQILAHRLEHRRDGGRTLAERLHGVLGHGLCELGELRHFLDI